MISLSGPMFEPGSSPGFEKILDPSRDGAHYSIFTITGGMDSLRTLFPGGEANDMNFVLFSTSGVHGMYTTLEDLNFDESSEDHCDHVTVLIVQPRIVCLRYGYIKVTPEDVEWLKSLRQSSWDAMATIGRP